MGERVYGSNFSIEDLNKTVNQLVLSARISGSGKWSIIFGIIAIISAYWGFDWSIFDIFLFLLGAAMLVEGAWIILRPSPLGSLVDGCLIIILGLWNIFISGLELLLGLVSRGTIMFLLLGIFQILMGGVGIYRYARYVTSPGRATPESVKYVNGLITGLSMPSLVGMDDIVLFESTLKWKGIMKDDVALFANGQEIIIAGRESVDITEGTGNSSTLTINGRTVTGSIDAAAMDRFRKWKLAITPIPAAN